MVARGDRLRADDALVTSNPQKFVEAPPRDGTAVAITAVELPEGLLAPGTAYPAAHPLPRRYPQFFADGPIAREHLRGIAIAREFNSPAARAKRERDSAEGLELRAERLAAREHHVAELEANAAAARAELERARA
jgi:hypothetical protein